MDCERPRSRQSVKFSNHIIGLYTFQRTANVKPLGYFCIPETRISIEPLVHFVEDGQDLRDTQNIAWPCTGCPRIILYIISRL